jgi:bifunctional non-homologous end joining protein LigD
VEQRIAKRRGRVYLDVARNAYGQTVVAPYAVRARPGAPVAAPITWAELEAQDLGPGSLDTHGVLERLDARGDPWRGMGRHGRSLASPVEKLRAMSSARAEVADGR